MEKFVHEWTTEDIDREAGNGAQELRNWITVASALGNPRASVIAYEAIAEWMTGIGLVRFQV